METFDRPRFATESEAAIYRYVERHGTAARHRVREITSLSPESFRRELRRLLDDGYLEEDDGILRLGLDVGSIEEHETEDGAATYVIRPARSDDFEGLVDAIRAVTDETTYVIAETVAEQLLYEDAVVRHNTVRSRVFFVATVDGDVVGWAHLDLPQIEKLRETAQLTVGVVPNHRTKGIGGELLQRALEWARANGYRKVYNSVPSVNDEALSFLESHGWQTEGIRKRHYSIGDEHVDEVIMAYEF